MWPRSRSRTRRTIGDQLTVTMTNAGTATAPLASHPHPPGADPQSFDVAPGASTSTTVPLGEITHAYRADVRGPSNFPRQAEAILTITASVTVSGR